MDIRQSGNFPSMIESALWGMDAKWVQDQLVRSGKSQADLARHLGIAATIVNKMVKNKRRILAKEADAIRGFFNLRETSTYAPTHIAPPSQEVRDPEVALTLPPRTTMPEDIPVLGTVLGGTTGGDFTLNGDTGMRVRRPPRLAKRDDIFALFVQGNSQAPRYKSGELIYLEKRRPPQNGDHVVIEMRPGPDGTQEAYLKELLAITPTKVRLQQYNPAKVLEIDRKKILQIIRVMTLQDLLGI